LILRWDKKGRVRIPENLFKKYFLTFEGKEKELSLVDTGAGLLIRPETRLESKINSALYIIHGGNNIFTCALSYLVDCGSEKILIDCGTDLQFKKLCENITALGFSPGEVKRILLTHCHYDHTSGAYLFKKEFGSEIYIHGNEVEPVEKGDSEWTAAFVYSRSFPSFKVDHALEESSLKIGNIQFQIIHTPGHTPGSVCLYAEIEGSKVLFSGDLWGWYSKRWKSILEEHLKSIRKIENLEIDIWAQGHGVLKGDKIKPFLASMKRCIENGIMTFVSIPTGAEIETYNIAIKYE